MARLAASAVALTAGCVAVALAGACVSGPEPGGPWVDAGAITGPLMPEVSPTPPMPRPVGNQLEIVTWNVHYGKDVSALAQAFRDNPDLAGADVILLQEERSYPSEGSSRAARLAAALGMAYAYAPAYGVDGGATHGLAILSPHPLSRVQVMRLPHFGEVIHSRKRIALRADVVAGGATLQVTDVHLDTRLNITDRVAQLHPAVASAAPRSAVGGDFNTNPYVWAGGLVPATPISAASGFDQAPALDSYMSAMGYDAPTATTGPTWSWTVFSFRFDSIYSRELQPGRFGVVRNLDLSDHDPVWLDIAWPP